MYIVEQRATLARASESLRCGILRWSGRAEVGSTESWRCMAACKWEGVLSATAPQSSAVCRLGFDSARPCGLHFLGCSWINKLITSSPPTQRSKHDGGNLKIREKEMLPRGGSLWSGSGRSGGRDQGGIVFTLETTIFIGNVMLKALLQAWHKWLTCVSGLHLNAGGCDRRHDMNEAWMKAESSPSTRAWFSC